MSSWIFGDSFIIDLLLTVTVNGLWKSVRIWLCGTAACKLQWKCCNGNKQEVILDNGYLLDIAQSCSSHTWLWQSVYKIIGVHRNGKARRVIEQQLKGREGYNSSHQQGGLGKRR